MTDGKAIRTSMGAALLAVMMLVWASQPADAAGTISFTNYNMIEKDAPNQEVPTGLASAALSVDFTGDAVCSCTCDDRNITYTWNFGDGTTANGKAASHAYGTNGAGNRGPWLHAVCSCGAIGNSNARWVSAIDSIRVDRIGDKTNPTTDGRLCFNNELRVTATALPVGVTGSDKIDWHLSMVLVNVDLANTGNGVLPNLADADWPIINSAWGSCTLYISIDGPLVAGQENELRLTGAASYVANNKSIEKFYDGRDDHSENPSTFPNWFYYYAMTSANAGTLYFDAGGPTNIRWENNSWRAYLSNGDNDPYTPPEGDNGGVLLKHIDDFAWTARHETRHVTTSTAWYPNGYNANIDGDGDWIPNAQEPGLGGTQQNPINGGPFVAGVRDTDGDGQRDDEDYTCNTQGAWTKGSADTEDWAHPGNRWE